MFAIVGDGGARPDDAAQVDRVRTRIRSRLPLVAERVERQLRLARIAARGPLAAFLKTTRLA
jgi:hypothetical protein